MVDQQKQDSMDLTQSTQPASSLVQDDDSDLDEDELLDEVSENDPPVITVQFEIKINSVKEVLLVNGVPVVVQIIRGEQKSKTVVKELQGQSATFGTKVAMKTTMKRAPGRARYERKDLIMRLLRNDNKTELGQAKINLANYTKCLDRKKFSIELQQSPFPEAMIEFAVTATPVAGSGRAATARAESSLHQSSANSLKDGVESSKPVVQSTRNSSSFNFAEGKLSQAKQRASLVRGQEDRQKNMVENLEKDFKKQIEDYEFKQSQLRTINSNLQFDLAKAEQAYQAKLATSYQDGEMKALQRQVEDMERELEQIDTDCAQMDAEMKENQGQLAKRGANDLSELGDSLNKISMQMAQLQQQITDVEQKQSERAASQYLSRAKSTSKPEPEKEAVASKIAAELVDEDLHEAPKMALDTLKQSGREQGRMLDNSIVDKNKMDKAAAEEACCCTIF